MPTATDNRSLQTMPAKKRNDVSTKVDKEVVRLAKIVAAYRGVDLNEYLSDRLRPLVESDLAKHQREQKRTDSAD